MKKGIVTIMCAAAVIASTACAPTVASYGAGSDSAAIRTGRNRSDAILTEAELEQHRRQRTNVSEEMDLEAKKRRNATDAAMQWITPLERAASGAAGALRR